MYKSVRWYMSALGFIFSVILCGSAFAQELALEKPVQYKWRFFARSAVHTTCAISGDNLYCGSSDGTFYALDSATGFEKWSYSAIGEIVSTPCVYEGMVYFGTKLGHFYALNVDTGEAVWKKSVNDAIYSSAVVYNDIVYFCGGGTLFALEPRTGKTKWKFQAASTLQASPAVADGVVYCGSHDNNLYAFDAVVGTVLWKYYSEYPILIPAVLDKDKLFCGNNRHIFALNRSDGKKLWERNFSISTPMALYNDVLYAATNDGVLYAITAEGGQVIWKFKAGKFFYSGPAVAGGQVLIACNDRLYGLDGQRGTVRWQFKVTQTVSFASCVLHDSCLYWAGGMDNSVYAIQMQAGA
jgi:eukaryotic-like serine/threonine-protein kinase